MPRPTPPPTTALAVALRARRGDQSQEEGSEVAGLPRGTLSRLERGTHRPTYDTAVKLAAWLGWTVEQVMDAASHPARKPEE